MEAGIGLIKEALKTSATSQARACPLLLKQSPIKGDARKELSMGCVCVALYNSMGGDFHLGIQGEPSGMILMNGKEAVALGLLELSSL